MIRVGESLEWVVTRPSRLVPRDRHSQKYEIGTVRKALSWRKKST